MALKMVNENTFKLMDGTGNEVTLGAGDTPGIMTTATGKVLDGSDSSAHQIDMSGGVIQQVMTPSSQADIMAVSPTKTQINISTNTNGDAISSSWTIENPEPTNINKVNVTQTVGNRSLVTSYEYQPSDLGWNLTSGNGMRQVLKTSAVDSTGLKRTSNWTYRNASGGLDGASQQQSQSFVWGESVVSVVSGTDGDRMVTTHQYNQDTSHPETLGQLDSTVLPTGDWKKYGYDSMGRVIQEISPHKDAPQGSDASASITKAYDYTPVDSGDAPLEFDKRARTTSVVVAGQAIGTIYHAYKTDDFGSVIVAEHAASPQLPYGSPDNLRTTTAYYGTSLPAEAQGKPRLIINPDGTQQNYQYVMSGDNLTTTIVNGSVSHPQGIAFRSTRVVQTKDPAGKVLEKDTSVYTGSGYQPIESVSNYYDGDEHLVATFKNNAQTYSATYTDGLLQSETDENGIETRYQYDALGRAYKKTLAGINGEPDVVTSWTYNSLGKVLSEAVSAGNLQTTKSYTYDTARRVSTATREDGGVTYYSYSNGGRVVSQTLPGGGTVITENYLDGRVKSITGTAVVAKYYDYGVNSDGTTFSVEYTGALNSSKWVKTTKDGMSRVVKSESSLPNGQIFVKSYTYNSQGKLSKKTETGLADELFFYNETGDLIRSGYDIDGNGVLTEASLDQITDYDISYQNLNNAWYAVTSTIVYANNYDPTPTQASSVRVLMGVGGQSAVEQVDANGNVTRTVSVINRAQKQVTTTTTVPGVSVAGTRITVNGLVRSDQPAGTTGTTTYSYDALRHLTTKTDPRIGNTTTQYEQGTGRIHSVTDPAGATTTYAYYPSTYSAAGQLQSQTDTAGGVIYYDYDLVGHVTRTWGSAIYPVEYVFDSVGRMVEQHTFRGGSSWGNSTWPASATADVTAFRYDLATGLLLTRINADGNATTYTYNERGQIVTRAWARIVSNAFVTTTYGYDPKTAALLSVTYSDDTPSVTYSYTRTGAAQYVRDAAGVRDFTYNSDLSMASEWINPDGGGLYSKVITRKYEGAGDGLVPGRSAGFTVKTGTSTDYDTTYAYDANGRLGLVAGPGLPAYGAVYSYENVTGLLTEIDYKETATSDPVASVQRGYDPVRNAIGQVTNSVGSAVISQYGYGRNAIGLVTNRTRTGTAFSGGFSDIFAYNDRHEVSGVSLYSGTNTAPTHQWGYSYDAIGNRLNTTGDLAGATNSYTPNAVNQYASVNSATLSYDVDGNLSNDGAFTYEWDGENRLKTATAISTANGAQRITFQYDYMGRRVEKAVYAVSSGTMGATPVTVERYVYNGWNVVEVLDGKASNTVVRKQTWGQDLGGGIGGLLSVVNTASSSPGWLYFYDGFGNVGQVVDRADNSIVARYEYDAYGNTTVSQGSASLDNPYRFSTKAVDNETGLIYYGYRYYSPKLGRWISRDPLGEAGGINLYGFVRNNPVHRYDPLGLAGRTYYFDNITGKATNRPLDSNKQPNTQVKVAQAVDPDTPRTYTGNPQLDDDGSGSTHSDPNHDPNTSGTMDANGNIVPRQDGQPSLNADTDAFVVAPAGSGAQVGDWASVTTSDGQTQWMQVGDIGKGFNSGTEISVAGADSLGIGHDDNDPTNGLETTDDSNIDVTLYPNSKPCP